MKENEFIKNVEKMIDPLDVGTVHFMQVYANLIPKSSQLKIINNGAKKNPYMGFVVEPYSFFLCYELKDLEYAKSLLPNNYELVKTKIFEDDLDKYYCIFGSFNVHSSVFWGTRMEFYIIAKSKDTGLISWVIIDYDTNTISFDDKSGLSASTVKECVLTTTYNGEVLVDIKSNKDDRMFIVNSNIKNGTYKKLDYGLWLEGNLSITYGKDKSDNNKAFAVTFNPEEVEKALEIDLCDVEIVKNNWFEGLFYDEVSKVVCFPYAQHFLSDSPGHHSELYNKEDLEKQVKKIDFSNTIKYSSAPIKKSFMIGQVVSTLLIIILTILLIIK